METDANYPQHYKLYQAAAQIRSIGEFMEWLKTRNVLAVWCGDFLSPLEPDPVSILDLIYEYLQIDRAKLDDERAQMQSDAQLSFNFHSNAA